MKRQVSTFDPVYEEFDVLQARMIGCNYDRT
jgi:hypothetical protein